MDSVVRECKNLTQEDIALLQKLAGDMGLLADLSRADVLVYCRLNPERAVVVSQARPHTILPLYGGAVVGREVTAAEEPAVHRTLSDGRRASREIWRIPPTNGSPSPIVPSAGAPIIQQTIPLRGTSRHPMAVVSIETNLIEHERHRRRSRVFQQALKQLQEAVLAGKLVGAERLTPLGEHDGYLLVDGDLRIQYVSGIATNLYRQLGYAGDLLKRHIEDLQMDDNSIVRDVMDTGECLEREVQVRDRQWIKQAIPLFSSRRRLPHAAGRAAGRHSSDGVLLIIRDETDSRRQVEELRVKAVMIQEIHHRVKNNMQTIASLLRLQSRRAESEAVRRALQEGINRILSVAVIHEFLAHQDARVINIRDVGQRIITQIREGVLEQDRSIRLDLRGPNIYLPTQQATVCALVINELLQNALEHGFDRDTGGTVTLDLKDDGERVTISVEDDGSGLPEDFDLSQTGSLGLQIVTTLAQGDLKGKFELHGRDKGVSAVVTFPKHSQGGR